MIYVMSDFHLPSALNKTMDVFGWGDHISKIKDNWPLTENDTIIIPGDISWALKLHDAGPDFAFIHSLSGKKVFLKGNHDIYWNTNKKIKQVLKDYPEMDVVYNDSVVVEGISICGTRGWDITSDDEQDIKICERELIRLKLSLDCAKTKDIVCFMHFPPLIKNCPNDKFHKIFCEYGIKKVYYGHLHGDAFSYGIQGSRDGVEYKLISADYLDFKPIVI